MTGSRASSHNKKPHLWLLAGGNGAGKSTFFETRLKPHGIAFVNADLIERTLFNGEGRDASYIAAKLAERLRLRFVQEGRSFCFETVFSHPSKLDFAAYAKSLGYRITLVYLHLQTSELNTARVAARVGSGGHPVPEDKIISRIPRTLELMKQAVQIADSSYLLDNSAADNPFRQIARIVDGESELLADSLPVWAETILGLRSAN